MKKKLVFTTFVVILFVLALAMAIPVNADDKIGKTTITTLTERND